MRHLSRRFHASRCNGELASGARAAKGDRQRTADLVESVVVNNAEPLREPPLADGVEAIAGDD